jgi:hypothetical protein
MLGASIAMAAELDDGDYTLTLPGVGDFEFTIASGEDETVVAVAAPDGYDVDDDDLDKAAWKEAAGLEVEAKLDKVEGDYDWSEGDATLSLPGGIITISEPDGDGAFEVTATGDWYAFGSGSDWYVANNEDITAADKFFKVEATEDGVEIKAADEAGDGFLNDLEEEEEEAEEVEVEEEGEDDGEGKGRGNNPNR